MSHQSPSNIALILPTFLVLSTGCRKEYITNEYHIEQASSIHVVGDTLFIDGDTVLLNAPSAWTMPFQTAGGLIDVNETPGPWEPSDALITQVPYPLHAGDRVVVLMQFTLQRFGPCQQPFLVNAGMHLGSDGNELPGSLTAVDVTGTLNTPEVWISDETTKSFTRVGVFVATSTWNTPVFKPFVRVWSGACGSNQDNYGQYMNFSSTLIGLPQ